jgi:hypothetical protein
MAEWSAAEVEADASVNLIQDGTLRYELREEIGQPVVGEALGDTEVSFTNAIRSCEIDLRVLSAGPGQRVAACALAASSGDGNCGYCNYTQQVNAPDADIRGFVEFAAGEDGSGEFTEDGCDPAEKCRFDLGTGLGKKSSLAAYPADALFTEGQSLIAVAVLKAVDVDSDGSEDVLVSELAAFDARFCTSDAIVGTRDQGKRGRIECTVRKVKGTPTVVRSATQALGSGFFAEVKITPTSVNVDPCDSCTISASIEGDADFLVNAITIDPRTVTMEGAPATSAGFVGTGVKQSLNLQFDRNVVIANVLASGRELFPGEVLGLVLRFEYCDGTCENLAGGGIVTIK